MDELEFFELTVPHWDALQQAITPEAVVEWLTGLEFQDHTTQNYCAGLVRELHPARGPQNRELASPNRCDAFVCC